MNRTLRRFAGMLAIGIIASLAPLGAQATHCASPIVIFSGLRGAPKVNSNPAVCQADSAHETPYDGRIINPGSNEISLRYTLDLTVPTLVARLNGLGFTNQEVILTRAAFTTGGFVYNSAAVALDPSQVGCLSATVILDPENTESNSFHTVGSSCPDFG